MPPDMNPSNMTPRGERASRGPGVIGPPEVAAFVLDRLGRAALEQAGRRWSGPQLLADVEARSVVLRDLGVRAGMRVALRVPLGHDYVVGLLASLCCGASVIPVDPADEWAWATALRLCALCGKPFRYGCSLSRKAVYDRR